MIRVGAARPGGRCAQAGVASDFFVRREVARIAGPDGSDICYATQNREQSVQHLAKFVGGVLVVSSKHELESDRLQKIGLGFGKPSYLIGGAADVVASCFDGVGRVGLTAGARASETSVRSVATLARVAEGVKFKFPAEVH